MNHRMQWQYSSEEDETNSECASGEPCKCCVARRRSRESSLFDTLPEWNSPLTPGVQKVNFSHTEDGSILRVTLGEDWARMFSTLRTVGPGLIMTRNDCAIVGTRIPMPALNITSGGGKAAGDQGDLLIDFRQLGVARAIHIRRPIGHVFGVEFDDPAGNTAHRFTLTPESDMDEFFAWVRLHQACEAHSPAPCRESSEMPATESVEIIRSFSPGALECLAAAWVDRAIPLRITVRAGAVSQRITFTPRSLRTLEEWWFLSDDTHGFHFNPEDIAGVMLQSDRNGSTRLSAPCGEDGGSLLIESGSPASEDSWRLILDCLD